MAQSIRTRLRQMHGNGKSDQESRRGQRRGHHDAEGDLAAFE